MDNSKHEPTTIPQTEQEWRSRLTPEQYEVLRNKGTERPFTGAYASTKEPGVYRCAGCGAALFSSTTKFESGTGWPSFWEPIEPGAVELHDDRTLWMHRTEVTCARCGGHLGHVFPDGPRPTGDRYCMNSVSLELEPEPHARVGSTSTHTGPDSVNGRSPGDELVRAREGPAEILLVFEAVAQALGYRSRGPQPFGSSPDRPRARRTAQSDD